MNWETLPDWFWMIYYVVLLLTLGTAVFSIVRKKMRKLSGLVIFFTILIVPVGVINSIGRAHGMNEFEHIVHYLQQGAIWAIFLVFMHVFIVVWWVLLVTRWNHK